GDRSAGLSNRIHLASVPGHRQYRIEQLMTNSPFIGFATRVAAHAGAGPHRRAVVCDGATLTYGALADRARRGAARIRSLGLRPGDESKVGIIAANSVDFAVLVVACQYAGVAVVPLPGFLPADALARMVDDSGAAVLFHDEHHAELVRAAAD